MAKLEIEGLDQAKALYKKLDNKEKNAVRAVLAYIDNAALIPEQSLLVQLGVIAQFEEAKQRGEVLCDFIADAETYAQGAIAEIGEEVRQQRHIGTLMGGIAICAILILITAVLAIVGGISNGTEMVQINADLNYGHVVSLIAVLAGTLFFVKGDKKAEYNEPTQARKRTQLVGAFYIVGFLAFIVAIFVVPPSVVTIKAVYLAAIALILLIVWKLSGRL